MMMPTVAVLLCAAAVSSAANPHRCMEEQESCSTEAMPAVPRTIGESMLQTASGAEAGRSATGSPPLRGQVNEVENELSSLEQRVATLEAQVGMVAPGDVELAPPPATPSPTPMVTEAVPEDIPEEAVLAQRKRKHSRDIEPAPSKAEDDDSWLYANGKEELALLEEARGRFKSKAKTDASLKNRVFEAERRSATLRSKILALENAVAGGKASAASEQASGSDLKHRLMSLADELDDLRTRTTTLEHTVMG